MKFTLVILFILSAGITFAQEDKILFESGYSLQYAHYDTALLEMLISQDSTKSNLANKIVNQLQLQAISKFDELITRFPNSTLYLNALYQKAEAEFSAGLNSEAKNTFLKVISLNPKKGKSLTN